MKRLEVDLMIKDGLAAVAKAPPEQRRRNSIAAAALPQQPSRPSVALPDSSAPVPASSIDNAVGVTAQPPAPEAQAPAESVGLQPLGAQPMSAPVEFKHQNSQVLNNEEQWQDEAFVAAQSKANAEALVAAALAALPPSVRSLPTEERQSSATADTDADYDEAFNEGSDAFNVGPELSFTGTAPSAGAGASAEVSESSELRITDGLGVKHRIGSVRFFKGAERPPGAKDGGDEAEEKKAPTFEEDDSVQMRRIRARAGEAAAKEPLLALRLQESYHEISRLMSQEREQAAAAASVLDKKKVPAENVRGLMSFIVAHQDEVAGATGGVLGTLSVESPPGTAGSSPSKFFSPLKATSPSPPVVSPHLIERQLSKVELYFQSVAETSKDVLMLDPIPRRSGATSSSAGELEDKVAAAALRLKSRVEWGGGKAVNHAKSKVDCGRGPKHSDDISVPNEFSEAEIAARRAAAERSKRLLLEIRSIERQLMQNRSGDRTAGGSARASSPRGSSVSPRESLLSAGASFPGSHHVLDGGASSVLSRGGLAGVGSIIGSGTLPSIARPQMPSAVGRGNSRGGGGGGGDIGSTRGASPANFLADRGRNVLGGAFDDAPPATAGGSSLGEGSAMFEPSIMEFDALGAGPSLLSGGMSLAGDTLGQGARALRSRATQSRGGQSRAVVSQQQAYATSAEPSLGPPERDAEFDVVARKLARLRTAELRQRSDLRVMRTYGAPLRLR